MWPTDVSRVLLTSPTDAEGVSTHFGLRSLRLLSRGSWPQVAYPLLILHENLFKNKISSVLGLFHLTAFSKRSHVLTIPLILAPYPP